jgi:hypothetical protein
MSAQNRIFHSKRIHQADYVSSVFGHAISSRRLIALTAPSEVNRDDSKPRRRPGFNQAIKAIGIGGQARQKYDWRPPAFMIDTMQPDSVGIYESIHKCASPLL